MKSLSIKNLFEFKDNRVDEVYENLLANVDKLQGLGLPDVCFINKRFTSSMFKSGAENQSSFHFIQGLCPSSQAEVCAYIQSMIQLQERDRIPTFFSQEIRIYKIVYTVYDLFSKTLLVCEFDLFKEGCHQFQVRGVKQNKQYLSLTKTHWEGAHISGILRAIDNDLETPTIGKFYNEITINCPSKLKDVITKTLYLIQGNDNNYQDLLKICSKDNFPSISTLIYYLNWPLYILFKHLSNTSQLAVLLLSLESLEDNIITIFIKSVIHYELKNYQFCLTELTKLSKHQQKYNLTKYFLAKVHIKLHNYDKAFLQLKNILLESLENQLIWTELAKIFRKQQQYQITILLLNKAAACPSYLSLSHCLTQQNLFNYQVLSKQESLSSIVSLSKIFEVIHPSNAIRIESFVQLSGYPSQETFLTRNRFMSKKNIKATYEQMKIKETKQNYKINSAVYTLFMNNQLLESNNLQQPFVKEVLKIATSIGHEQLRQYLGLYFYSKDHSKQNDSQCREDIPISEFQIIQSKNMELVKNVIYSCNKSMMEITESDHDKEFQKDQQKNMSFDFSNASIVSLSSTTATKLTCSPDKSPIKKKNEMKNNKTYTVIMENTFESLESDRQNIQQIAGMIQSVKMKYQPSLHIMQGSSTTKSTAKVRVAGLISNLNPHLTKQEQSEITRQMRKKKDLLNHTFQYVVQNVCKVQQELENLFSPQILEKSSQRQNKWLSIAKSPQFQVQFKSNLKNSLKTKVHLKSRIDIKEFYFFDTEETIEDKEKFYHQATKTETLFLYKCAKLAIKFKQLELAKQLLIKINQKTISVQVKELLFELIQDDPSLLLKYIQQMLLEFGECGIQVVDFVPLWIETNLIKLTTLLGSNKMLGLLSTLEPDFTFALLKKSILRADNII